MKHVSGIAGDDEGADIRSVRDSVLVVVMALRIPSIAGAASAPASAAADATVLLPPRAPAIADIPPFTSCKLLLLNVRLLSHATPALLQALLAAAAPGRAASTSL